MQTAPAKSLQKRQVIFFAMLLFLWETDSEAIRYSMPEETESGYSVANLAKDLGLRVGELATRGARIHHKGSNQLLQLDEKTGNLLLQEKLDREVLCGATEPCVLHFQLLLENPVQLFQIDVLLTDVNDHSPEFLEREMILRIPESAQPGTVFPLKSAQDLDMGSNSVQNYTISPNSNFRVVTHSHGDGRKYPELVLDKALDREEESELSLTLTALDVAPERAQGDSLTVYLVIALASVSSLFLFSVLVFMAVKLCRRRRAAPLGVCSVPEGHFPGHLVDVSGTGTLSQSYQYEVCLTSDSGTSDFKFLKPIFHNVSPKSAREATH
ncbi:protocadherin beta-5-like [Ictidomys tridecemlineatus]|uniref:protocadherin beta-5-like n=1 Tax=Ictidomys tridecemlineatus TaxID=43179 RepID=UPI000B53AB44|nr:protocadherin beta-5-like [Ictidomys tridecemlineatus]KAG3266129.1 protocadherin beta-5-like [Ictidomys tridecemlineatus]